ncbi:MAG: signal peptidase II [Bacilli bacterium]|nr:signal peptidase II [Bacilli bacterium]MDD4607870.1 signal peptidase II [Bacilli bacterium]
MKKITIVSIVCILIDQLIKIIITNNITLNTGIEIIKDFFYLSHVRNYGAAWSIFTGSRIFLIIVAFVSLFVIYFLLIRKQELKRFDIICYGLLYGGIIGNLLDRIILGYVIDYLDFNIINYNFPVFNFADSLIVISVFLIIIKLLKEEKNGISNN